MRACPGGPAYKALKALSQNLGYEGFFLFWWTDPTEPPMSSVPWDVLSLVPPTAPDAHGSLNSSTPLHHIPISAPHLTRGVVPHAIEIFGAGSSNQLSHRTPGPTRADQVYRGVALRTCGEEV